jgi:hypothetical protein
VLLLQRWVLRTGSFGSDPQRNTSNVLRIGASFRRYRRRSILTTCSSFLRSAANVHTLGSDPARCSLLSHGLRNNLRNRAAPRRRCTVAVQYVYGTGIEGSITTRLQSGCFLRIHQRGRKQTRAMIYDATIMHIPTLQYSSDIKTQY